MHNLTISISIISNKHMTAV